MFIITYIYIYTHIYWRRQPILKTLIDLTRNPKAPVFPALPAVDEHSDRKNQITPRHVSFGTADVARIPSLIIGCLGALSNGGTSDTSAGDTQMGEGEAEGEKGKEGEKEAECRSLCRVHTLSQPQGM
ncbi:hypothetical protein KIPB_013651 [Kipferlia bialata]|uniref:Uncharacterized protein n=1 Tax=Kipferlia bialata TaxID=797122 RepID=A0A9K3DAQ3_9EUKA|nr:hypothetical protein KIPB_013651 [Kipferlia bialata]|eukprot:g13651.t1